MRRHQPLMIEHIGEQQVVHVAAVAGHIHYLMAILCQLAHPLCIMDIQSLIEAVPGPAENAISHAQSVIGEVSGHFVHHGNGILTRFFNGDFFGFRFIFNGFFNRFGFQQLIEQLLTHRQFRADSGHTLAREVNTGDTGQFISDNSVSTVFRGHCAHGHRL